MTRRRFWFAALALAAAVLALYAQTGSFDFIRLDDHDYTFRCPFVRDGFSFANLAAACASVAHAAIWMPATYVSYMLDVSLFGPGMGAHHLVNVAIHALNSILVFILLLRLLSFHTSTLPLFHSSTLPLFHSSTLPLEHFFPALLAAAFWALHPLRVEPVAWIAGRKELLFTCFTLLGLLAWTRQRFAWGWLCCALACASKPTALVFPALAFLIDQLNPSNSSALPLFHSPTLPSNHSNTQTLKHSNTLSCFRYLPPLAMSVATGAVAVFSQTHPAGLGVRELFQASLPWRVLNAIVQLGLYVFQTAVPYGVHIDHRSTPGAMPLDGALGLAVVALVVLLVVAAWRRGGMCRRAVLFASAFALVAVAPTLGVFGSFGEHARADRFFYLPSVAVSYLVAVALADAAKTNAQRKQKATDDPWYCFVFHAVIAAVIFSVLLSRAPIAAFRNDESVFAHVLLFDAENGRALAHVGNARCARGDFERGVPMLRQSQKLRPRFDVAAQLAYALAVRGRPTDVAEIRALGAEVAAEPSRDPKGQMLEALGMAAGLERKWDVAAKYLAAAARAPRRFTSNEDVCLRLAVALYNCGRRGEAEKLFVPLAKSGRPFVRDRAEEALARIQSRSRAPLAW